MKRVKVTIKDLHGKNVEEFTVEKTDQHTFALKEPGYISFAEYWEHPAAEVAQ